MREIKRNRKVKGKSTWTSKGRAVKGNSEKEGQRESQREWGENEEGRKE